MNLKLIFITIALVTLLVFAFGCDNDHHNAMSNSGVSTAILRVYPNDGEVGVSTSASIAVKFNRKMDTLSVMNNLHLMEGAGMHMWMDTTAHHGGMGNMTMGDMDHMMNWMDSIAMPGSFSWNATLDSCEYTPASGMMSNEEHMIFMDEGGMMDHNGGMMGPHHAGDQYHSYHFMTGQ